MKSWKLAASCQAGCEATTTSHCKLDDETVTLTIFKFRSTATNCVAGKSLCPFADGAILLGPVQHSGSFTARKAEAGSSGLRVQCV